MTETLQTGELDSFFSRHPRLWKEFQYVYPVISRRSRGLSIGINLNIDKACNFDCLYCCVDRNIPPVRTDIDLDQLRRELDTMLNWASSGQIWETEQFQHTPARFRRINDIAFSGDGEPTAYSRFGEACRIAAELKDHYGLADVKLIVLTNATLFHKPRVQEAFDFLDRHNTDYWVKLDAGTEAYYQLVDRCDVPFDRLLANILDAGRKRPIILQSLFMAVNGEPLPDAEFEAYCDRVADMLKQGCRIKDVQLHTIARQTAESYVQPLSNAHLDRLLAIFKERFPDLNADVYYGVQASSNS
jgi:wyosine [tRNA(Phe)-imidazoG37] synthetase (radical SAM superfamily)